MAWNAGADSLDDGTVASIDKRRINWRAPQAIGRRGNPARACQLKDRKSQRRAGTADFVVATAGGDPRGYCTSTGVASTNPVGATPP
jgi:hypothetical protein